MTEPVQLSTFLSIEDLEVQARIGVNSGEWERLQPLLLAIRLELDPPASDGLEATVDYCEIQQLAVELGASRIGLVETYARRLAESCLGYPLVRCAEVTVRKPAALAPAMAAASVRLQRRAISSNRGAPGDNHSEPPGPHQAADGWNRSAKLAGSWPRG